jgi:hypothetical protein
MSSTRSARGQSRVDDISTPVPRTADSAERVACIAGDSQLTS